MKKVLPTFQYLLKSSSIGILLGFLIILSTAAITDLVFFFTLQYQPIHQVVTLNVPIEVSTGIFSLLIGLVLFISTFKVTLANGISRKTFLLANLPTAAAVAAAFSIFNLVVVGIHNLFWPANSLSYWPVPSVSQLNFPQANWAASLIFQFALYFLLIVVGWFVALAYYGSTRVGKWAISFAPFVLYGLLRAANARAGGAIFEALGDYHRATLGFQTAPLTLLVYAAILCGLVYVLIRRTPLRD